MWVEGRFHKVSERQRAAGETVREQGAQCLSYVLGGETGEKHHLSRRTCQVSKAPGAVEVEPTAKA